MAELSTQARPYARAVFELAERDNTLGDWSATLAALATVVGDDTMRKVLGNPKVAGDVQMSLLKEAAGAAPDAIADKQAALINVLADNGRLGLLPELSEQFESLKAAAEGRVTVVVTTAVEASDKQLKALGDSLRKRLNREIDLESSVDADIKGGFIVRAGDLVIDQSLSGRLNALAARLAA